MVKYHAAGFRKAGAEIVAVAEIAEAADVVTHNIHDREN